MLRSSALLAILITALLICSCANPAADKSKAVTKEAAPITSPAIGGDKYSITNSNSKIEFIGSKVTGNHHGSFQKFTGAVEYAGAVEKSRVTIAIEMNSVNTDTPDVTKASAGHRTSST